MATSHISRIFQAGEVEMLALSNCLNALKVLNAISITLSFSLSIYSVGGLHVAYYSCGVLVFPLDLEDAAA